MRTRSKKATLKAKQAATSKPDPTRLDAPPSVTRSPPETSVRIAGSAAPHPQPWRRLIPPGELLARHFRLASIASSTGKIEGGG